MRHATLLLQPPPPPTCLPPTCGCRPIVKQFQRICFARIYSHTRSMIFYSFTWNSWLLPTSNIDLVYNDLHNSYFVHISTCPHGDRGRDRLSLRGLQLSPWTHPIPCKRRWHVHCGLPGMDHYRTSPTPWLQISNTILWTPQQHFQLFPWTANTQDIEDDNIICIYSCSRREDGLSCWHGVKPPLTHSCNMQSRNVLGRCVYFSYICTFL